MFEKIENKWTEDSGDYDDMIQKQLSNKRTVSHWTKELKRLLGPEPLRILEVGCGPGFMSIIAARLGHDVKAIDGSSGMVEKARRNMRQYHQQVEICEEDGVTLPLEQEQSYDVILSRDAVWTLYDPEKAFRRWKAVCRSMVCSMSPMHICGRWNWLCWRIRNANSSWRACGVWNCKSLR